MKRAIVTGASGFIGRNLVYALLERGYKIIALDVNFNEEYKNNPFITCIDVRGKDIATLKECFSKEKYDCFYHLAWAGTSGDLRKDYEIQLNNAKLACDYILLAKEIGCRRVVYASSINEMETYEYLQSDNIQPAGGYVYGAAKLVAHLMGETVAYLNNVEFIPVIITNIYGVGEKSERMIYTAINKLLRGEHCSFTSGCQMYDFIYITDAINSIIAVAEKGKAFNRYYIGSGDPKPLREFLVEMRDIVSPKAEIGLGDIPFNGIDISYDQFQLKKVKNDTGYENLVSFSDGIKMTADYVRGEIK